MTPLLDFPPESDAKNPNQNPLPLWNGMFTGRKERAPESYNYEALVKFAYNDAHVGKQVMYMLASGDRVSGEVIGTLVHEEKSVFLIVRSYENDIVRYYYVNPASVCAFSFIDIERKSIKEADGKATGEQESPQGDAEYPSFPNGEGETTPIAASIY